MTEQNSPILLTGASGGLGVVLASALSARGCALRLTDLRPFPGSLPERADFVQADLQDGQRMRDLARGCRAILHFGGVSVEQPFDDTVGPNLIGLYNIYEAARAERIRMVFASSNHTIGFYPRDEAIDIKSPPRPDGYYGLSKIYGEGMARLYWDKHGIETVNLRIGSCRAEPTDARMLATWLSHDDLVTLVQASLSAPEVGCCTVWGVSANAGMGWWVDDDRALIGWAPRDDASRWRDRLQALKGDAIAERFQGGGYCAEGYSR